MTKSGKHGDKKKKLLIMSNFFICHHVFKKPSAAEASESVYMREIVQRNISTQTVIWYLHTFEEKTNYLNIVENITFKV